VRIIKLLGSDEMQKAWWSHIVWDWPLMSKEDNLMRGGHANDCECKGLNQ